MQRREAILLLREMTDFPETILFTTIFLQKVKNDTDANSENYELHIKTDHYKPNHKLIKHIAKKHHLKTKNKPNGYLIIYTPTKAQHTPSTTTPTITN